MSTTTAVSCSCHAHAFCPRWNRRVSSRAILVCRSGDEHAQAMYFGGKRETHAGPSIDRDSFITTARLMTDAQALVAALPPTIDCVVGVARSGLLPATLVATYLHLPLWSVSTDRQPVPVGHGVRLRGAIEQPGQHAVIIDDTAASGDQMSIVRKLVASAWPTTKVTTAVVYSHPRGRKWVDLAVALLPGPHYLEWNFANAGHSKKAAFDFDGVLCTNGAPNPLYLPRRHPVELIVTGRSERGREGSEAWLRRHGVAVERMVMRPGDVGEDSRSIARYKAGHYKQSQLDLFVESEPDQAELIAAIAQKPVLCPAAGRVMRAIPRDEKCRKCATCGGYKGRKCGGCTCNG